MSTHPNLTRLTAYVDGVLAIAQGKSPEGAHTHLMGAVRHLNSMIGEHSALKALPSHLEGLTLADLTAAQERLVEAMDRQAVAA